MKIFLIEDDAALAAELEALLRRYGYETARPCGFEDAAGQALAAAPDLVLLDVNLPCADGFAVCRQLRAAAPDLPVILLTSRTSDFDELLGLELGAEDFITKPCHPGVLLARLQKALRRAGGGAALRVGPAVLDLARARLSGPGGAVELTRNELCLLRLLMESPGRIIPRETMMVELWQSESFVDENTLNVNMVRLRKKLAGIGLPNLLRTRRGLGYLVEAPGEAAP